MNIFRAYNWYRRPRGELVEYSPVSFATDLLQIIKTVPEPVLVGGNTGTVNFFTGVDLVTLPAVHTTPSTC